MAYAAAAASGSSSRHVPIVNDRLGPPIDLPSAPFRLGEVQCVPWTVLLCKPSFSYYRYLAPAEHRGQKPCIKPWLVAHLVLPSWYVSCHRSFHSLCSPRSLPFSPTVAHFTTCGGTCRPRRYDDLWRVPHSYRCGRSAPSGLVVSGDIHIPWDVHGPSLHCALWPSDSASLQFSLLTILRLLISLSLLL